MRFSSKRVFFVKIVMFFSLDFMFCFVFRRSMKDHSKHINILKFGCELLLAKHEKDDCKTRFLTISQHHFKTLAKTLTEHTTKHRNQHHGTQDAVTGASETPMTTKLHVAVFFIVCVCLSHWMTRATNAPHGPYWFRTTTDQCWIQKRCGPKGADRPWRPEKVPSKTWPAAGRDQALRHRGGTFVVFVFVFLALQTN